MSRPLDGIRVVDFTNVVAGPLCTQLLSDMGAEVIKVERVGEGDFLRKTSPEFVNGMSVSFMAFNRNKKSITVDTTQEKGREVAFKLVATADVVVENFRPGVMDRLGLGYEVLSKSNPRIIYCSISGYGQTGPYRRKAGQDLLVQGIAGVASLMGDPGGPPVTMAISVCDLSTAMLAAWGVTLAIVARDRFGVGQRVEANLLDSTLMMQSQDAVRYLNTGQLPMKVPISTANPKSSPNGVFKTQDGYITINATSYERWTRLTGALGLQQLTDDERYNTLAKRAARTNEVRDLLEEVLAQKTNEEWLPILEKWDVLCSPIRTYDQVFTDPQVAHNNMVVTLQHPTVGEVRVLGVPVKLSATPGSVDTPPPDLGQHTDELLESVGYRREDIEAMRRDKTV